MMELSYWDEFYKQTLDILKDVVEWCNKNSVQFEPYARNEKNNEMECTCCFAGDIDGDKPFIAIKIGTNGDFEVEERCDEHDGWCDEYVKKDLWDIIGEYDNYLNNAYISWGNLTQKQLKDFCKTFNCIEPKNESVVIKANKVDWFLR